MSWFRTARLGLCVLLCVSICVAAFQMYCPNGFAVPRRLLIDEFNLVLRVPLARNDCFEICQGVGSARDRIEVEGKPIDQNDLHRTVLEFLDRNAQVKAIVFSVGISNNNHERAETMLRNVSIERHLEFFPFFENSKYSLEYLPSR